MNATQIGQWLGIAVSLLSIGGVLYWLTKQLTRIQDKIDTLVIHGNNHIELTGFLARQIALNDASKGELVRLYTTLAKIPPTPTNPFSPEEQRRYAHYAGKAQRGESFLPEEVEDFRLLAQKFRAEHPNDTQAWALLGLIALLIGLYLLSKKE